MKIPHVFRTVTGPEIEVFPAVLTEHQCEELIKFCKEHGYPYCFDDVISFDI